MTYVRPPGPVGRGLTVALYGGSFNPAHEGHVYVAECALKQVPCDYVWWLVSPGNPLKPVAGMAPLAQRMDAARRLARHPRFRVSAIESAFATRYTVDTLRAILRRFPAMRFVWLMGSDNLESFSCWRRWADILRLVPVVVVIRPGSAMAALKSKAFRRFGKGRIRLIDGRRNAASASAIRALAASSAP